jgi:hypothetical protein
MHDATFVRVRKNRSQLLADCSSFWFREKPPLLDSGEEIAPRTVLKDEVNVLKKVNSAQDGSRKIVQINSAKN